MPLPITTLPTEAAVSKTFSLIGADRNISEHVNISDTAHDCRLFIRQSIFSSGPKASAVRMRRANTQFVAKIPVVGNPARVLTLNITFTAPEDVTAAEVTEMQDQMSFARALLTASNVTRLLRGENGG